MDQDEQPTLEFPVEDLTVSEADSDEVKGGLGLSPGKAVHDWIEYPH